MPEEPTLEELKAANETLREFVAVAAHELRGPMAAILGYASTMRKHWDRFPDEEKVEFLGIIERRSRYLSRLLDSLLTLSKIEAGALEV
ncbi:MAG TPA: histidine kinase dimerization/phospho-acceptor domain-containing protein, partial [Actinomycetota bacterium]